MTVTRRCVRLGFVLLSFALATGDLRAQTAPATTSEPASAKFWIGRALEVEDYIRTAAVTRIEKVGLGVTSPNRAYFAPDGPADSIAWKPIKPAIYSGHRESYLAEIAGYELDKVLGLNMVPPAVERRLNGELGAAILWIKPTKMFKEFKANELPTGRTWDRQVRQMKMFHDLAGNDDPNAGNLLIDPAGNLILIDFSRAFATRTSLTFKIERVDPELWDKMKALTEETLAAALGKWLNKREIRAILERRGRMQKEIDQLVAAKGEAAVFVKH